MLRRATGLPRRSQLSDRARWRGDCRHERKAECEQIPHDAPVLRSPKEPKTEATISESRNERNIERSIMDIRREAMSFNVAPSHNFALRKSDEERVTVRYLLFDIVA